MNDTTTATTTATTTTDAAWGDFFVHSTFTENNDNKDNDDDNDDDQQQQQQSAGCFHYSQQVTESALAVAVHPYKIWKNQRNVLLQQYMEARLLGVAPFQNEDNNDEDNKAHCNNDNNNNDIDNENGNDSDDDDDNNAGLDSQPAQDATDAIYTANANNNANNNDDNDANNNHRLAHVNETVHAAQHLADVTLWSRTVSAAVCAVHHVTPLRALKRAAVKYVTPATATAATATAAAATSSLANYTMALHADAHLPRLVLHPTLTDDGPLATCFSQDVLSMEIRQVSDNNDTNKNSRGNHNTKELRQRAEALREPQQQQQQQQQQQSRYSTTVYFYNHYATAISEILQQNKARAPVYASLSQVPAKCVLPHPPTDWYSYHHGQYRGHEQEHSQASSNPVCLCIGDHSSMRAETDSGSERVRFDAPDLVLWIAFCAAGGALREFKIAPGCTSEQDTVQVTVVTGSPLTAYLQRTVAAAADIVPAVMETQRVRKAPGPPATEAVAITTEPTPPSPKHKKLREQLLYLALAELQSHFERHTAIGSGNQTCEVNVYGVVLGFGSASKTRRGDCMVGIALVDDTLALGDDGIHDSVYTVNINIFTKALSELPDILYAGDVLRMHRVKLQAWSGQMQLMGQQHSSYVVCRDDNSVAGGANQMIICPTAKAEFTLTTNDERRFAELWKWGQKRLFSHASMKVSQSFKLADMRRQDNWQMETYGEDNTRGDLTVMVAAILPVPKELINGISPRGFLRVWDGTGFPASDPMPLATAEANEAVMHGDPPPEAIVCLASIIKRLQTIRPNPTMQTPKAVSGRVANVAIWEDSHWGLIEKAVRVGSFIRLRNVQDSRFPPDGYAGGLRCLMVYAKSYLTPLPDMTYEVLQLVQDHNQRLLDNEPLNPMSGLLPLESGQRAEHSAQVASVLPTPPPQETTVIKADAVVRRQLGDLLAAPIPTLYSGFVRIMGTIPPLSTLSMSGVQSFCSQDADTGQVAYRFAIQIKEGSGPTVDAIVEPAVGEILVGMKATSALVDSASALFNLQQASHGQCTWKVTVGSVAYAGAKYFWVKSIEST